MVERTQSLRGKEYNIVEQIERIQEDAVVAETAKFIEVSTPMEVRVTTSQQIVNMNDHKDVALVIDMRSQQQFLQCSLDKSVNFAIEKFNEDSFIFWSSYSKKLEADTKIFTNKTIQNEFKRRRRYWVYIIAGQESHNIDYLLLELSKFATQDGLKELAKWADSEQKMLDLISMRNAFLLYKALKKERLREMDISIDGFDKMERYYSHFCKNAQGKLIIERPQIADCYPNEIFLGRLWLGDWHHAKDAHVIDTLKITHILNISDSCENYLSGSHPHIKYLRLNLHDTKEQQVDDVFVEIHKFIMSATFPQKPESQGKTVADLYPVLTHVPDDTMPPCKERPVSNQVINVDFKQNTTLVSAGKQQSEYVRVQKLFRQINKDNPAFNNRCFVHCAMGKSRSATSVIMFIMKVFSMKLDDAYEYVKTQREQTEPNEGFIEQLRKFQDDNFTFTQEMKQEESTHSDEIKTLQTMLSNMSLNSGSKALGDDKDFFGTILYTDKEFVDIFETGPVIPRGLVKQASTKLMEWQNQGINAMELNNKSNEYNEAVETATVHMRNLLKIPDDFAVIFSQGYPDTQFSSICYNLLGDGCDHDKKANYLITGQYSLAAQTEGTKHCLASQVATTSGTGNKTLSGEWNVRQGAKFFHYCDDESKDGFEFIDFPFSKVPDGQILIADMSQSITTKPINWEKHDVVYAGAQQQLGLAGLVITIVRKNLIGKHQKDTPAIHEWEAYTKSSSTSANLPSCWSLYTCGLNLEYMLSLGGVNELNSRAKARSDLVYSFIDESNSFYTNQVDSEYRSRTNIPFRIQQEESLETKFVKEASNASIREIKSNKLVGGCRVSLNNTMSFADTYALISFMTKFMQENQRDQK